MTDLFKKQQLAEDLETLWRLKAQNRGEYYKPYPKQSAFHTAGNEFRERLFAAGNQSGKTLAGSMEMSYHLTGRYPDWWTGKRFNRPIRAWAIGPSSAATRDTVQRKLLGDSGYHGQGSIPKDSIHAITNARNSAPNCVDSVQVKHRTGRLSYLGFKSYDSGRERLQGETLDLVWCDEEPPPDIYSEVLTRTTATKGIVFITATPLLGMSSVMAGFFQAPPPHRCVIQMSLEEAGHISAAELQIKLDSWPEYEREARSKGVPSLGSGRVYPVAESVLSVEPFAIPPHWGRICGIDFGWDHPFSAAWLAHDRDNDIAYVVDAYQIRRETPAIHAAAINGRGKWIPVAWPHDGLNTEKGSGESLGDLYRKHGVKLLPERAKFQDGSNSVEAGVMTILERMRTGRFKVFSHLSDWLNEFRMYHRKDGKIVKQADDLMDATRYAVMEMRSASTEHWRNSPWAPLYEEEETHARHRGFLGNRGFDMADAPVPKNRNTRWIV